MNEPGYWKLLIDFKMYDNNGVGSPQMPVTPDFNMTQARRMLKEYDGGHAKLPVAQDVVDDFVKQYKADQDVKHLKLTNNANTISGQISRMDKELLKLEVMAPIKESCER